MRVRLGINNCFALKRWPAAREWASVVRNDLGLGLVELSLDLLEGFDDPTARPRVVEATRTALADHGLTAQATFTGLGAYSLNLLMHPNAERREAAQRWFERVIDISAELRVRATGGHIGSMSVPEWSDRALRAQRWAGLKTYLSALAARARDAGLEHLMVENMVAVREPATIAQVEDLLDPGDAGHVPCGSVWTSATNAFPARAVPTATRTRGWRTSAPMPPRCSCSRATRSPTITGHSPRSTTPSDGSIRHGFSRRWRMPAPPRCS